MRKFTEVKTDRRGVRLILENFKGARLLYFIELPFPTLFPLLRISVPQAEITAVKQFSDILKFPLENLGA